MRYFLFGGAFFYAEGGANDFISGGDDLQKLIEKGKE